MTKRRLPTLLGLFIIVVSLVSLVFLFKNARNLLSIATVDNEPAEVKITNISDNSFTISWVTLSKTSGTVNYGEDLSLGNILADDRDQVAGQTTPYFTHHSTLRYLKPSTKYYFKIISGSGTYDNDGEPYIVTTAPSVAASNQVFPVYGTIVNSDGSPAVDAIVYLDIGQSPPLSTLVKSSGSWLITLNNARTADLTQLAQIKESDKINIFVQAGTETAQATAIINHDSPIPQITLGKNYNFSQTAIVTPSPKASPIVIASASPSASPKTLTASPSASPISAGFQLPAISFKPSIISPASGSSVPSDRPVVRGTGIPGKIVTIKIESDNPITGTATVDQNGNWKWTPPEGLSPGNHTATVNTVDANGKPITLTYKFIVLESGTSVIESATTSGSLKVSPSPSPTPKASPTPKVSPTPKTTTKPTATTSASVRAGNIMWTTVLSLLGLIFISLGLGQFLWIPKRIDKE
ncbi:MAG: Ig-like domain-containing protein [Candidatus Gottesmanbacteria bacterium]